MRKLEMTDPDYRSDRDLMAAKDGGPKQDWGNGMLSRLAESFSRPTTPLGRKIIVVCWIGMACAVVAGANLALGRPWF